MQAIKSHISPLQLPGAWQSVPLVVVLSIYALSFLIALFDLTSLDFKAIDKQCFLVYFSERNCFADHRVSL